MNRETFKIDGLCWCPGELRLSQLRLMGHTEECSQAREGWRRNRAELARITRQRRADEELGRQIREEGP